MFKSLLKIRLSGTLSSMTTQSANGKKSKKAVKTAAAIPLLIFLFAIIAGSMGVMFFEMSKIFHAAGADWMYFSLSFMIAFALMFIGSVFLTQSQIFDAKDNELLLSMPIPPGMIVLSRILSLLVINLGYGATVILPAGIVYAFNFGASVGSTVCFVLTALLLPFASLAISCLFGWLISLVMNRVRNKSAVVTVMSLIFLFAYIIGYNKLLNGIGYLTENAGAVAGKLSAVAPVYYLGNATASADFVSLLYTALISIIPFAAVYALISARFISTATDRRGAAKREYKASAMKVSSPSSALLKREIRHFFGSPVYLLNSAIGEILMIAGIVFIAVKHSYIDKIVSAVPALESYIPLILGALLMVSESMNLITAPSVSIEGKHVWILQSLPVDTRTVLRAKLRLHLIICIPTCLICSLLCAVTFGGSASSIILLFVLPAVMTVFSAMLGLAINLMLPKMDWQSETVAVKQSLSVIVAMLAAFAASVIPIVLYFFVISDFIGITAFAFIFSALLLFLSMLLYRWLMTSGKRRFEEL